VYDGAASDRIGFWEKQAEGLTWTERWHTALEWEAPFAKWFVGGKLNASVNCLDRHLAAGFGDKVALHWIGDGARDNRTITYADLHERVCEAANALIAVGVRTADLAAIYMPVKPEQYVA